MKKLTVLFLITQLLIINLTAQTVESQAAQKKQILFEKLYLHVDREMYAPGDVIWIKAYQVNGITHQPNTNYRNIFVELVAENGRIVDDLMLFSIKGQASGELHTDSLSSGIYTVRAYTKYLKNFGEDALFHQKIWIGRTLKKKGQEDKTEVPDEKIAVNFLPEGGNLITNALNNIAFKAINQDGRGIAISGKILSDSGDTIVKFSTSFLGIGKFLMMPLEGKSYYALIDGHPELKINLNPSSAKGVCMKFEERDEFLMLQLSSNTELKPEQTYFLIASHKGTMIVADTIKMTQANLLVKLSKSLFPDGISKITLLDTAQNPVAERLIFIENTKNEPVSLRMDQKEFKPHGNVKIDVDVNLEPGDSISSGMSVSVVNRSFFSSGESGQNLKSYLLLDSDLKGVIESPASWFMNDQLHSAREKLDLLMLVHGWRTYIWDDVVQTPQPSLDDWNDAGINVSGFVKRILWKAPAPEAEITMDYAFRNFRIGKTTADRNGRFLFRNIYLLQSLRVMLNAQARDGSHNAEIILDPVPRKDSVIVFKNPCLDMDLNSVFIRRNKDKRMKELDFTPEFGSILLNSVDIVQKQNNAIMRSSGAYPWADRTLTITRDDYGYYNLLDYLKFKVPTILDHGDEVTMKGKPVFFMVDGLDSYYSFQELRTLRMNEIATIDIINPGFRKGFSVGMLGVVDESGLIAIYKKEVPDIRQSDIYVKGRIMPKLRGFKLPAKFYVPDYSLNSKSPNVPDVRSTLFWDPEIELVNGKASISFYTSDVAADYVVSLEGISKNGKVCCGTTGFSVK